MKYVIACLKKETGITIQMQMSRKRENNINKSIKKAMEVVRQSSQGRLVGRKMKKNTKKLETRIFKDSYLHPKSGFDLTKEIRHSLLVI